MRRPILAALLSMMLLAWPASAQIFPTASPEPAPPAPTERVIFDASLMVIPPGERAPCMRLEAGQLTIRGRNTGDSGWGNGKQRLYPTTMYLAGYRGEDQPVDVRMSFVEQETTTTVELAGAMYCWSFAVDAPVGESAGMSVRTNYSQFITVRMTLTTP